MKWEKKQIQGFNPIGRAGHISFVEGRKFYCFGGYDTKHNVLSGKQKNKKIKK